MGDKVAASGRVLILCAAAGAAGGAGDAVSLGRRCWSAAASALWFALPGEPGVGSYALGGAGAAVAAGAWLRGPELARPLAVAAGCLAAGLARGGHPGPSRRRADAGLSLLRPGRGPDRRDRPLAVRRPAPDAGPGGAATRCRPTDTPLRVRVSLQGEQAWLDPMPGQVVILTASLAAPEGPVEPGGFDFRRMAFFDQLGAVGYTRTPGAAAGRSPSRGRQPIDRLRALPDARHAAAHAGQAGAFAAGAMTGDRSAITARDGAGACAIQLAGASAGDLGDEHGLPHRLRLCAGALWAGAGAAVSRCG